MGDRRAEAVGDGRGVTVQPDPTVILETLSITEPLIGLYDAPDPAPFAPIHEPSHPRACIFVSYPRWQKGQMLHITRSKHGCGALHLLGLQTRSREEMVRFLVDEEGLRASHELMECWLDAAPGYQPRYEHLLIGPMRPSQYEYLRSATFFVNADQLAVLATGSSYYSHMDDPPVSAPFGSGCGQLASVLGDLDAPRAIIGATDQAMRRHLDPGLLAFTVTRPMFELLCRWADDPASSLHNNFLRQLFMARGGSL